MGAVDGDPKLAGQVEVDETFIGGVNKGAGRGRGLDNKTALMGMMERDGNVMTKVIPDTDRLTLLREIGHNVRRGSTIHTDEYKGYAGLEGRGYKHTTVNHKADEYVNDQGGGTQGIDGYWSRLQNSISGTHVHVSGKHLQKYAWEFEYRYNSRHEPEKMIDELLSEFPKRDGE